MLTNLALHSQLPIAHSLHIVYILHMKKILLIVFALSLVLSSCDLFDLEERGDFWAINLKTNIPYRVDAELLYTGQHCEIWAEKDSGITVGKAQEIASEYDNKIYQRMINAFSSSLDYYGYSFSNTMAFADWLVDGNGKLCILLLDIKDNYEEGVNESWVAGYFSNENFINGLYSNRRNMIYIDTYPSFSKRPMEEAYKTLAHEMQHLMNFVTSYVKRSKLVGNRLSVYNMDTWVDEGLSSAAEYVYSGEYNVSRIDWYKYNGGQYGGLIDRGNNFYVWGNRTGESVYANQDDYSTVYLFFQWLRLQSGGTDIYKNIISSTSTNHEAVVNAIYGYSDWDTLLKTWLAANYINASSGEYGYFNEEKLKDIRAPTAPSGTTSLNLYPGEGVYSIANVQPSLSGQGSNIRNVYINTTTDALSGVYEAGSTLLTYNKSIDIDGAAETGVTTGVAASVVTGTVSGGRSVTGAGVSGPFRIDAGDLLRQNGYGGFNTEFSFDFDESRRAETDE